MNRHSVLVPLALLLGAFINASCSAPTPTQAPASPPATQWSDVSTPIQPTLQPTDPGQVNYEPTAAASGQTPYSGYACAITHDGCTCDSAVVIRAAFTFPSADKMTYEFHGDTYGASWDMTRLGPNQWSYTIPIGADETNGTPTDAGHYFIVLTFKPDGYTLLQSQDRGDGTQTTCKEVAYTRLSSQTPAP